MSQMITVFDTTLRDGEQSPGCSMRSSEKLEIAYALEQLRVDVIEAGFAISSPGDFASVQTIAEHIKDCSVASLCRANEKDIDAAAQALAKAAAPRIHVFIATSDIHMEKKLRMSRQQVLERAAEAVRYAKKFCADVQFSAEDASRSDRDFLRMVVEQVIQAGATTVNIPDTVGYIMPRETESLIAYLRANCKGADSVTFAVHPHNDLGMATANCMAGIEAGARQVEVTLCGIGERAGNAALEEVVMGIHTRRKTLGLDTRIDTRRLYRATRMLSTVIGQRVPPNKPIIGNNAFAHEAGIHQHGVMADRNTYEIMCPADIGIPEKGMVLGKHSGRHAFEEHVSSMGYTLDKEALEYAFAQFKDLCDKKKTVTDRDIEAILKHGKLEVSGHYQLGKFVINAGNTIDGTAILTLKAGEETHRAVAFGDGPVDAAFKAINTFAGEFALENYTLNSITDGGDALGEALVRISNGKAAFTGRGLSTDIIEASILAYLNAVNKALQE